MKTQEYDAVVIGTGPAGAATARELARKKKKVLILEKGKWDTSIHIAKMLKDREMMFLGKGRSLVRGLRTGGSSILYYGTAFEPPEAYFIPFGISLSEEIAELQEELPIAPLNDELMGPSAQIVMESAQKLGYPWKKLNKLIDQDLCAPGHFPYQAQWNALNYVQEALDNGAVLINDANVTKVITKGGQAAGVEYRVGSESKTVYASPVILSAGGIGSAQILQRSGFDGAGEGFFCDPLIVVQGVLNGLQAGNEIPMAAGMVCQDEGYMLSDITLPKKVYQVFAAQALRLHRLHQHRNMASMMVKIKDSIGGSITGNGKVKKNFAREDQLKMRSGLNRASEILKKAGAKHLFHTAWTSAHPGGSVRIGHMVDTNLMTECEGLFVCDCSVIPAEWGMPPTLTLLALAKRLAKHILAAKY